MARSGRGPASFPSSACGGWSLVCACSACGPAPGGSLVPVERAPPGEAEAGSPGTQGGTCWRLRGECKCINNSSACRGVRGSAPPWARSARAGLACAAGDPFLSEEAKGPLKGGTRVSPSRCISRRRSWCAPTRAHCWSPAPELLGAEGLVFGGAVAAESSGDGNLGSVLPVLS